jgi:putative flippase GtrA
MSTRRANTAAGNWLLAPTSRLLLQLPRAFVVSALAALLDMAALLAMVELCGMGVLAASSLGYLLGGLLQYILSQEWVFANSSRIRSLGSLSVRFLRFQALSLVGLFITWFALYLGHERLGIHYLLVKSSALGLAFTWNFASRRVLVFRESNGSSAS